MEPAPGVISAEPILPRPVIIGAIADEAVEAGLAGVVCPATGAGKVLVRFQIRADGSVTEAEVRSTSLRDPVTEACLVDRVKAVKFPPLDGGEMAMVMYPFQFPTTPR